MSVSPQSPSVQFPKMGIPNLRGQGGCCCGRRGLPRAWVLVMYADYQRLGSLAKAGRLHNRTRQNMFGIFQTAALKLNSRRFRAQVVYRGRRYTEDGAGYLRDTILRSKRYAPETFLHRRVWMDHFGPIPPGHTVCFKDGNRSNCALSNLELLTHDEQQQRRGTGRNQFTVSAGERLELLLRGGRLTAVELQRRAA